MTTGENKKEHELKPCPFCGNARILPLEIQIYNEMYRQWCDHCGALGPPTVEKSNAHQYSDYVIAKGIIAGRVSVPIRRDIEI